MTDLARIRQLAANVDTTAICDADKDTRVVSPALRCRSAHPALCGPALTVRCREDFFGVVQAIEEATPGQVLVVDGGGRRTALAGELLTRAAMTRGLAGIIVDGGYRDMSYVATSTLPVYSRYVTPMAGTTNRPGVLNQPVGCGGVLVSPGDIVIADVEAATSSSPTWR
ncbi:MAG: hypothetical protein AUI14_20990, partial [Actinobacteria bacterium 13_2_20CM_2_71_6]